jgi:hypothetical protein
MAKPKTLDNTSTAKERSDANRQHHQQMASHLINNAVEAGHGGHMLGRQGGGGLRLTTVKASWLTRRTGNCLW